MALTDKLRDLDQKLLPGTRGADEDAESYLRRVAASRAITPAQAGDVMAALRQYFDVQEGQAVDAGDDDGEGAEGGDGEASEGQPKDSAEESEESDEKESESDEKEDDES